MTKEPEIIYKRRNIKAPILWEKTYYGSDIIGGTEKEKWSGVLFLYRFLILQGSVKNRFLIELLIEEINGNNNEEMVGSLQKLIEGKEEWELQEKHFKDADFFPDEVNNKLKEFNLEKYVKIS